MDNNRVVKGILEGQDPHQSISQYLKQDAKSIKQESSRPFIDDLGNQVTCWTVTREGSLLYVNSSMLYTGYEDVSIPSTYGELLSAVYDEVQIDDIYI